MISQRKAQSIKNKVLQALVPIRENFDGYTFKVYWENKKDDTMVLTLYYRYRGVKYRFDKIFKDEKLTPVSLIRKEIWETFSEDRHMGRNAAKFIRR